MFKRIVARAVITLLIGLLFVGCFPRIPPSQASMQPVSTDASFSPNEETILFSANHDGDLDIYTVNTDGTNMLALTSNDDQDFFPSWSPDGNTIVFSSDRGGSVELYLMDADGSNQRLLIGSLN